MLRTLLAALYRSRLSAIPAPHPKYGAFDKAALRAAADLFETTSHPYAKGALIGALQAKKCGLERIRMIEFGVASGRGMLELVRISNKISQHLEIQIDLVGLDNATGLPQPKDYRDHPEIWGELQFAMGDQAGLRRSLPSNASLIIGDISETAGQLNNGSPIAFISIDVDFYSSTAPILHWLETVPVTSLLPATPVYFDDVFVNWTYSVGSGEELAISEFNARSTSRRLDLKDGESQLFAFQAFDHPLRTGAQKPIEPLELPLRRYVVTPKSALMGPPE